ncbi:caspase-6-like [Saccostrea echinata]|uniref:caspase-6-like n=1 Tax=Saccostrea echinata TaxID=191078 RepID=UPI002A7F940F|nr:caspase-6-like [Saccostrea echinata]
MDPEQQGNKFWENFEEMAKETEPDGLKAFKKTLTDFLGLKSKKKKRKHGIPSDDNIDEDKTGLLKTRTNQNNSESRAASSIPESGSVVCQSQDSSELHWSYPESSRPLTDHGHQQSVDDNRYLFRHEKLGYAVLVINSKFDSQAERKNAAWDVYYMRKMFQEMGFEVKLLENLTSRDLLTKMKNIQQSITKESDCFACVISSHGMEGQISTKGKGPEPFVRTEHFVYTRDGVVRTTELLELFNDRNCRALRGKPRMFFIQACRGRLDIQKADEVDMGVEVPVHFIQPDVTKDGTKATAADVGGIYDDYEGRRPEEFRNNFYFASLNPLYEKSRAHGLSGQFTGNYLQAQSRYVVKEQAVKSHQSREPPCRTTTYKFPNIDTKPENIEVFQIPCFNDFLVMFSSAAGTIAWSDQGKGGWLMYCLYHVFRDITYTNEDLMTSLTRVCGKMAIEMETYCPSTPHYDKAKSAACVYHKLTKDIYLQPVSYV